ncbi:MAG TPA: cadherin-like beta sandwich domain-containing protein [Nitrospira sp.]|nr:cadherin-like beta sandwich domain-containing protein [Nitrospira sp.]
MKHLLISASHHLAILFLLTLSLLASGCRDSASISESTVEVPLSSLTITPPGTLQPAFSSNTTSYIATVPTAVTSVTVTASPTTNTTTIIINGTSTPAGQGRPVSLGQPGSTTSIEVVASAQNGIESTYRVTVTRLSSDNNLSALLVTANNVAQPLTPDFETDTTNYTANVSNTVERVTVSATKSDQAAALLISSGASSVTIGAGVNPGQLPISLGEPGTSTPVSIEVTAPNGTKKTYQVTVNRLSGNNTLRELSIIPGTFDRPFDPVITSYIVTAPFTATQVTVTAIKSDRFAAMSGNVTAGAGIESGTETFSLGGPGSGLPLSITVAAPDPNVPPREYRITVNQAVPSNNANLSALTMSAGSLNPPSFTPDGKIYEVKVDLLVNSVTLTVTKSDPNATMSALGSVIAVPGVPTGHVTVTPGLGVGTLVKIDVRAEDGVTSSTYDITVIRRLF